MHGQHTHSFDPAPTGFRRTRPPRPVEVIGVPIPGLPPALAGLRILHLTDTHARRPHLGEPWFRSLTAALAATRCDIAAFTGDYMNEPGDEPGAVANLRHLRDAVRPRLGAFGVFGNHDTGRVRRLVADALPDVHWLDADWAEVPGAPAPLWVAGWSWPEDTARGLLRRPAPSRDAWILGLVHNPSAFIAIAQAHAASLVLGGHTHAGQVRLGPRFAPCTSSDVPTTMAAGRLRLGETACCISRGLGEAVLPWLRLWCPRQAPLYVLEPSSEPPADGARVVAEARW